MDYWNGNAKAAALRYYLRTAVTLCARSLRYPSYSLHRHVSDRPNNPTGFVPGCPTVVSCEHFVFRPYRQAEVRSSTSSVPERNKKIGGGRGGRTYVLIAFSRLTNGVLQSFDQ